MRILCLRQRARGLIERVRRQLQFVRGVGLDHFRSFEFSLGRRERVRGRREFVGGLLDLFRRLSGDFVQSGLGLARSKRFRGDRFDHFLDDGLLVRDGALFGRGVGGLFVVFARLFRALLGFRLFCGGLGLSGSAFGFFFGGFQSVAELFQLCLQITERLLRSGFRFDEVISGLVTIRILLRDLRREKRLLQSRFSFGGGKLGFLVSSLVGVSDLFNFRFQIG